VAAVLLDVNVLIALAWPDHEAHARVGRWFSRHSRAGWATCPFTQAGFVRILSNPLFSPHALTLSNALAVLQSNVNLPSHQFWPANISVLQATEKVGHPLAGHRQVTDAYLLGLAIHQKGRFATLDRAIATLDPGGFVELLH
jgi:toxin-antitoxin system PIN domain toxin